MFRMYINSWKKSFWFAGRASRKEYWWFLFVSILVMLALIFFQLERYLNFKPLVFYSVFIIAMIIPTMSITVRRLHDIGLSSLWILPLFILSPINTFYSAKFPTFTLADGSQLGALTILNFTITVGFLIAMLRKGTRGVNAFGLPNSYNKE